MNKRRGIILAGVLVVAGVWFVIWGASGPPEPVYEGRKLTSWLERHLPNSSANPPYNSPGWHKAEEAIRRIGTNGIPTLLRMLRANDPPRWVLKAMQTIQRRGWLRINYRYAMPQHEEAEYAFRVLGTNAASAVPELIKIYQENRSPSSQRCAAMALSNIGRPAQAAVPVLIKQFNHADPEVRFHAVSAVMHIGGEPNVVVPALTGALKDSNVNVRWDALIGLSGFGSPARAAVPEIMKMLDDPGMVGTSPIKEQVEIALWRIAPEKVGKPLVIEQSTPIIDQGKITQAIKMTQRGRRETLIPAGTSVPTVRQYWSSDPRPRLEIHRGPAGASEKDHLLGYFEVLDLPPSERLNISTLCVVVDGQIFLCARDNTRERFLEIRRVE